MIQQRVMDARKSLGDNPCQEEVSVVVEMQQRYYEYLDALLDADLKIPNREIIISVEGRNIKFKSEEELAEWITSLL